MQEVFLFHSPQDRDVAEIIAARLDAQVRLEPCDNVEESWDQGLDAAAILLLLSPSSTPAAATREKWSTILKHRETGALPPLGFIDTAPCKCPQILQRKHFFRYSEAPRQSLRDLAHWITNLTPRPEPSFQPARLPWLQGRAAEIDQLWESLVDEAGVTILIGNGKTALAQEFARAASSHFRDLLWIECGERSQVSIAGELAAHLGVSLGNRCEDAFARIGVLIQEKRVLLVLDDVPAEFPAAAAGGGLASVLVTTQSADLARMPGATVIELSPPDRPRLTQPPPAANELWSALQACRSRGVPLELAARVAKLEVAEIPEARQALLDQRWIDPVDAAGLRYRASAHSEPQSEAYRRWHAEALVETFSKWGTQPGPCRSSLAEMDVAFHWALRSNWKIAKDLGHRAAGFLNRESRAAEAIYLYRQLLRTAHERNDAEEIQRCSQDLSWVDERSIGVHRDTANAEQTAFDFAG